MIHDKLLDRLQREWTAVRRQPQLRSQVLSIKILSISHVHRSRENVGLGYNSWQAPSRTDRLPVSERLWGTGSRNQTRDLLPCVRAKQLSGNLCCSTLPHYSLRNVSISHPPAPFLAVMAQDVRNRIAGNHVLRRLCRRKGAPVARWIIHKCLISTRFLIALKGLRVHDHVVHIRVTVQKWFCGVKNERVQWSQRHEHRNQRYQ